MKYLLLIYIFLQFQICFSEHFTFFGITRECEKDSDLDSSFVYGTESLYVDDNDWVYKWDWSGDDKKVCGIDIKKEYCLYPQNKFMKLKFFGSKC